MMDEIAQAQARLGKVLDRARAGEDRALAGRVRDDGERLVNLLFGALGMARMHALDNRAFDQPMRDLSNVLGGLLDLLGVVHLLAVEDQVYVNDIRIRLEARSALGDFSEKLKQHGIGGLSFHQALTDPQLRQLVASFSAAPAAEKPRMALQAALAAAGLSNVELVGIHRFRLSGEKVEAGIRSGRSINSRGAALLDESFGNLAANRIPNPLPLRRLVTDVLDVEMTGEIDADFWSDPDESSPYAAHTLRIAKLALLLGRALGMPAGALQDLGVAAMFHDMGYAAPQGASEPAPRHPDAFEGHPAAGARLLIKQRGFHEAKIRRVLATLDHHRPYDDDRGKPSLFGRILALVEDYDTLVQERGGGMAPPEALARIAGAAGSAYDPVLTQLLVNTLGQYPAGTLLRLSDGRLGRAISLAREAAGFARPIVRIERLADGATPSAPVDVDLMQAGAPKVTSVAAPREAKALPRPGVAPETIAAVAPRPPAARGPAPMPSDRQAQAGPAPAAVDAGRPAAAPMASAPAGAVDDALRIAAAEKARREGKRLAGKLNRGVLPEILRQILIGQKTGTLFLFHADERRTIRFWKGNVISAGSNKEDDHLGELAVRLGLIGAADLNRINEVTRRERKRVGAVLLELELMDESQVQQALSLHAREVIVKAFPWGEGEYQFEEQQPEPDWFAELALKLSTPDLILEAVRCIDDPDVLRFQLGNPDRILRLTGDPRVKFVAFGLKPLDGFVLSRVDGQLTAREVLEITPGDTIAVQCSLLGLVCAGVLEFAEPSPPSHQKRHP